MTQSFDLNTMHQPKATRAEALNYVMTDYDEVISELPNKLYSDLQTSGRFAVSAVRASKARTLLFDAYGNNGKAIPSEMGEVLTLLQSIKGYSLAARVRGNFTSEKQLASPEIVFSVRFLCSNLTHFMDSHYGTWTVLDPTRNIVDAPEYTDGKPWGESPLIVRSDGNILYGNNDMLKKAERARVFMNRDRHLYELINYSMMANSADDGQKDEEVQVNKSNNKGPTGFSALRYIQPTDVTPGYSAVSDVDVIVLCYTHILLMTVEVENEAHGATTIALNVINKIGTRSGQLATEASISQDDLRERIRNERRIEICLKGSYYFQLKRWGLMDKPVNGAKDPTYPRYIKVYKSVFEFFPTPQSEIDKAGGVLKQDPAYG